MTRQEAIQWLRSPVRHYECEDCWYSCATICCDEHRRSSICDCGADQENSLRAQVADMLEAGPSVPEAEAGWIPVSERLPEPAEHYDIGSYSDYVLVWVPWMRQKVETLQAAYTPRGEFVGWVGLHHSDRPDYWMPRPDCPPPQEGTAK